MRCVQRLTGIHLTLAAKYCLVFRNRRSFANSIETTPVAANVLSHSRLSPVHRASPRVPFCFCTDNPALWGLAAFIRASSRTLLQLVLTNGWSQPLQESQRQLDVVCFSSSTFHPSPVLFLQCEAEKTQIYISMVCVA